MNDRSNYCASTYEVKEILMEGGEVVTDANVWKTNIPFNHRCQADHITLLSLNTERESTSNMDIQCE